MYLKMGARDENKSRDNSDSFSHNDIDEHNLLRLGIVLSNC